MRRALPLLAVFALGALIGWLIATRPARRPPVAPVQTPTPVAEISVSRPDPTVPDGFSRVRLRVVSSGTQKDAVGRQEPGEWNLVFWHATEGRPHEYERFRCVPVD